MDKIERYAEILDSAALHARATPQLTHTDPDLSVADAYLVQKLSVDRRLSRGERRIGVKMGLTSRAKRLLQQWKSLIAGTRTSSSLCLMLLPTTPRLLAL